MPSIQPDVRVWEFTRRSTQEKRTYEQSELTIDGEMQLFGLINRAVTQLARASFPFERLAEVFPPAGATTDDINWGTAAELLSIALPAVPALLSEAAAALLGIFMTDEHGNRNRAYDDEVAFLRRTLKTADLIEMAETFVAQNDIQRLRAPLARALQSLNLRAPTPTKATPSNEPSTPSLPAATARPPTSAGATRGKRSTST